MKFIVYAEWCPEDMDKVIEKSRQLMAEGEKFPDKYPKGLSSPYQLVGESKGVRLYEGDEEQLTNYALHYMPEVKLKFVPIVEFTKTVELYQKMKK